MTCDQSIKNRIKRTAGQLNGVLNMIEDSRSCEDVVMQLLAIKSNVDKLIAIVTTNNLIQAIEERLETTVEDVDKEIDLIIKNI